jgi:superfamily I DNA/RNA helicase
MAAKKKKKVEIKEFSPSKYQKAIFDFIKDGNGNAVVEAEAGSGKSTVLVWSLNYIPEDAQILFTAFNTDIVTELKKKIEENNIKRNVDCRTLHSLGYRLLMSNFPKVIDKKPNDFKYRSYVYNNVNRLGGEEYAKLSFKSRLKYSENLLKFIDFGRFYLCQTLNDLIYVENHYHIPCEANEKEVALKVMEWGKENYQTIDFTDMIWLPNVLNCKPYGMLYDWILADEVQDVSKAERELLLRCTKMSTRMLLVGQKIQSINAFQGSDYKSFEELQKLPNTITLPLSISYRCGKNIVKFANRFSPTMEATENAPDGEVKFNVPIEEVQDGDMVLCRVNAPLLQMYCELIKLNKPAHILGKDIGTNLIKVINKTKEEYLYVDLRKKGVFSKLYNDLFDDIDSVMRKNKISFDMALDDMAIAQNYDIIQALEAISVGSKTAVELTEKIATLFSDANQKGITLSTIHKAKGLEADNVYICCPSLLPAKSAKDEWEKQQESNLEYVAYTRPRKILGFLDEKMFSMYSSNSQQKANTLNNKKGIIFNLYGSSNRCSAVKPNKEAAKQIIQNATNVDIKSKNSITLDANSKSKSNNSSLTSIKKNKKKQTKRR